ncbi:translocating chain-associated membrane protein 1-like 1 isoform X1 [Artemia franciscana]|uniref:translocating chain-associated membrane protein 1-like 1 isoform X1 n=1 Tax=Artemia franciscana TaxID=6661 RepID=UPI0032DAF9DC
MPMKPVKSSSKKSPPILSHEFVLQNHADIVSCVAMVFIIGLMFQVTQPLASLFIAMQHNITIEGAPENYYTSGWKDNLGVFFYILIGIVIHAVIQEYVLDKINRKLHLSKIKHSEFNESGQLTAFFLSSAAWGINILVRYEPWGLDISSIWKGYPHTFLPFILKFFYIIQIAYWLHWVPEFYFQRIKPIEYSRRLGYIIPYFFAVTLLYVLNFHRLGLWLLSLHYLGEALVHVERLLSYSEKEVWANKVFSVMPGVYTLIRLAISAIASYTFVYGLPQETEGLEMTSGNYNIFVIRMSMLAGIVFLQVYLLVQLFKYRASRLPEEESISATKAKKLERKQRKPVESKKSKKESKKSGDEDLSDLPEADQDQQKARIRPGKVKP